MSQFIPGAISSALITGAVEDDSINSTSELGTWLNSARVGIVSTLSIYISASTGSDSNTGLIGYPLASFAEFIRRYGETPLILAPLTITFLDATVSENISFHPFIFEGGDLLIKGTRTIVSSGSITSAPTARNAATNTSLEITDSARTWASHIATHMLVMTSGAALGAVAFPIKDTGSNKCRLTSLVQSIAGSAWTFAEVSPSNGNTYDLVSLTKFTWSISIDVSGGSIYSDASFCDALLETYKVRLFSSQFSRSSQVANIIMGTGSGFTAGATVYDNMIVSSGSYGLIFSGTEYPFIRAGGTLFYLALYQPVSFRAGFLVQSTNIEVDYMPSFLYIHDMMFQDWSGAAIYIYGGMVLAKLLSGASAVVGSHAVSVYQGQFLRYSSTTWASQCPIDGQAAHDFTMGHASATQGAPYNAGVLAAEQPYTFAKLDTAVASGGFGKGTVRLDGFAVVG